MKNNSVENYITISPEVERALKENLPVAALESTIITHGMPYPRNVECARRAEAELREAEVVPATIAIVDGRLHIGLDDHLLDRLGQEPEVRKVSRRDIASAIAAGGCGGTTVAATLWAAEKAGIKIFVTGGIGGVHRNGGKTFDISADLPQLAASNVIVVCAGAKSILDIPMTLEYLETQSVPVLGYRTHDFPAFFTVSSGSPVGERVESPADIVRIARTKWDMGIGGGILVANPIPEESAMPREEMEKIIDAALSECAQSGIHGKEITPMLLARIEEMTQGKSLTANIALLLSNVRLGGAIARAYYA